jgi:alpha-tubulin suppressor-like RCC1 family protein
LFGLCAVAAQAQTIATGARHALALQADGSVLAWGDNRLGQLGQGRTLYAATARVVPVPAKAVAVQASNTNALVLDDQGNVWSWGTNRRGELGDGTRTDRATPQIVFRNAALIAGNGGSSSPTFVIDKDGQPWWWGPMPSGGDLLQPTRAAQVPARLVTVAQYGTVTAGLDDKGVVWAWGEYVPCAASPGPTGPVAMAGLPPIQRFYMQPGGYQPNYGEAVVRFTSATAFDTSGQAWKWGAESGYGPGGGFGWGPHTHLTPLCPPVRNPRDDAYFNYQPIIHSELLRKGVAITRTTFGTAGASVYTSLGLSDTGELWQWRSEYEAPPGVTLWHEASDVVDASHYSTPEREGALGLIYVTKSGTVYAKGTNYNLHLGIAHAEVDSVSAPQKVDLPGAVMSVHAKPTGSFALLSDGTVYGWGAGAGRIDRFQDVGWYTVPMRPVKLEIPAFVSQLAVAGERWMALTPGGEVWALATRGAPSSVPGSLQPFKVSRATGMPAARQVLLGGSLEGAILGVDGTLWHVGYQAAVQPGTDGTELAVLPWQFGGLPPIKQVAMAAGRFGNAAYFALDAEGAVWFRGQHSYGLGGLSEADLALAPMGRIVQAPFVRPLPGKAVSVHAGDNSFCAVLEDGSAQCYGKLFGENLGMRFTLHVPIREVSIGTDGDSGGTVHFRLAGGRVWAWGKGQWGQLGAGIHAGAVQPVPVIDAAGTADLDLDPFSPDAPAPAAVRPPFRVKTQLAGNQRSLSFGGTVFGSRGTPGDSKVYAMAASPTGATGTWVQLDAHGQWGPLRWPVPAIASGVQLSGDAQSISLNNILRQFAGTGLEGLRFYIGYGRDVDEMLAARRFREVLELAPEALPAN